MSKELFSIELEFREKLENLEKKNNEVLEEISEKFKENKITLSDNAKLKKISRMQRTDWQITDKVNGILKDYLIEENEEKKKLLVYDLRKDRHYDVSVLPVRSEEADEQKQFHGDVLPLLYQEICTSWRMLTDVRFKLLGLVPLVSVVAWVGLATGFDINNPFLFLGYAIIAFLAHRIIIGIRIYDLRNDELYDDLISRGRRIEKEMGIDTGLFRGRKKTDKDKMYMKIEIKHGKATSLIYESVLLGWKLVIIISLILFTISSILVITSSNIV
ncbi:MAG: hypothetical protein ACFFD4_37265 [Candidatus Odinarchaeota archaeon]